MGSTSGAAAGLNAGLNPVGTISFAKSKTNEEAASSEKTILINRIDHYDNYGMICWSFNIDDVNFRESGTIIGEDYLPTVHFKFTGDSDEPNPPPTYPPKCYYILLEDDSPERVKSYLDSLACAFRQVKWRYRDSDSGCILLESFPDRSLES